MSSNNRQVLDIRAGVGFTREQSDEHQRRWSEKAWEFASRNGNYDRSREHLNFEVSLGCVVRPVDKSKSIPQRIAEMVAERGIFDRNTTVPVPRYRTIANVVLGGSRERMHELAFGDQKVDLSFGADNSCITRSTDIEEWAKDMYRFACEQWGEENIVQFICHLDETNPHIHATILPVDERNHLSFKNVFAGKDKFAFKEKTTRLHNLLAEVNKRWGLGRGMSITETGAKHRSTEEYRRDLARQNNELEEKIASHNVTIKELMTRISRLQNAIKGLNTMLNNLNAKKRQVEDELDKLRHTTANTESQKSEIEKQIREKESQLEKINSDIADKSTKLEKAKENLEEMERLTSDAKFNYEMLQKSMHESAQSMRAHVGSKIAQVGFEELVHSFARLFSHMVSEKDMQLFDGSLLKDMAERGNHIFACASLLFVGYIDQATQVAKDCGGGGNTSNLPWGRKEDEDDRAWARRCLLQAQMMTRPAQGKKVKR